MKRAISVTLERDNVTWLKARAGAERESVSELLDQIVTVARQGARTGPPRSVAGTIDVDSSDPLLEQADASVRADFDSSLARPLVVPERPAGYQRRRATSRKVSRRRSRG